MYFKDDVVRKNYLKAFNWLSVATQQGNEASGKNLNILRRRMTKEQIAQAQSLANKWWTSQF